MAQGAKTVLMLTQQVLSDEIIVQSYVQHFFKCFQQVS